MTTPQVETLAYLHDALAKGDTWAVLSQDAAGNLTIAAEVGPGSSETTMAKLVGPTGPAGTTQFPLRLQAEVLDSPALLPTDLTNTAADIGRYWIIDVQNGETEAVTLTGAFIWFGTEFRFLPFGNEGPPGPYGIIAPYVTLLPPDQASQPVVAGTGTAADPYIWDLELSIPEGPPGPCCPVAEMTDFAATIPTVGQYITATDSTVLVDGVSKPIWTPANVGNITPQCYTVPQSAFTSAFGITFASYVTIASFSVPSNPWDWKPVVFGQIQMFEIELSFNPLQIGIEVYVGSPNPAVGTLVARGFGNTPNGVVTIMPHTSSPATPTAAMTPTNSLGLVSAGHGGPEGTVYVNLVNDGIAAVWDYNPSGAELFVMACPVSNTNAADFTFNGSLHTTVTLSANVSFSLASQEFRTSGTWTPPSWWTNGTDFLDIITVGAGGGASTAGAGDAGGPGHAGAWATDTIQHLSTGSLTVTVGAAGAGSSSTSNGSAGGSTIIKDGTTTVLTAAGGAGGTYEGGGAVAGTAWHGPSPGNETYESQTYNGGLQTTTSGGTGGAPGGGGAGADQIFQAGGNGAAGAAWIVARKA